MSFSHAVASRKAIRDCVYRAIDEVNAENDLTSPIQKSESACLFGAESNLDSLELVSLVVSVEQQLDDDFGVALTLADEKAMSQKSSPFRTVATLIDYVREVLTESSVEQ